MPAPKDEIIMMDNDYFIYEDVEIEYKEKVLKESQKDI